MLSLSCSPWLDATRHRKRRYGLRTCHRAFEKAHGRGLRVDMVVSKPTNLSPGALGGALDAPSSPSSVAAPQRHTRFRPDYLENRPLWVHLQGSHRLGGMRGAIWPTMQTNLVRTLRYALCYLDRTVIAAGALVIRA